MIRFEGYDGGTPTRPLAAAVHTLRPEPDVSATAEHWPDISVVPRCTELPEPTARADAWYDMYWSYPRVTRRYEPLWWLDGEANAEDAVSFEVRWESFQRIATIPAPPRLSAQQRLEQLGEPTLEGWSDEAIRFYGGPEGVLKMVRARRDIVVRYDTSVGAYDWEETAARIVAVANESTPPRLTPQQRAQVSGARLLTALHEVGAARMSVRDRMRNAESAGAEETEADEDLRALVRYVEKTEPAL